MSASRAERSQACLRRFTSSRQQRTTRPWSACSDLDGRHLPQPAARSSGSHNASSSPTGRRRPAKAQAGQSVGRTMHPANHPTTVTGVPLPGRLTSSRVNHGPA
jgi:hypothetical protein